MKNKNDVKVVISFIVISLIVISVVLSGCITPLNSTRPPLSVKYEIHIDNPNEIEFNLSVPTLVLGNRYYNTQNEGYLEPVVDVDEYAVVHGEGDLSYTRTDNCTFLMIESSSKNVSIELIRNEFSYEDYSEYKEDSGYFFTRVVPFLNSYYNRTKGNYGYMNDMVGIIYSGDSSIDMTIFFENKQEGSDEYLLHDDISMVEEGFQLKEVTIKFTQPPP
ncbi:MAG: hypothetical protein R6U17_00130 [Thermoplasmata archaeon]